MIEMKEGRKPEKFASSVNKCCNQKELNNILLVNKI